MRTLRFKILALVGAARRISDGDYRQPVNARADGNVAVTSSALNAMQESIAEREQRILYQARVSLAVAADSWLRIVS